MNNSKPYEVQLVCHVKAANEADAKLKAMAYPILNLVELKAREISAGEDVSYPQPEKAGL